MPAKLYFILFCTLVTCCQSFGQRTGYYIAIPTDSGTGCRLRFLTDDTIEISTIPRHMVRPSAKMLRYTSTDNTIEILADRLPVKDSLFVKALLPQRFSQSTVILTRIRHGFIDYNNSIIYLTQKRFDRNAGLTWIIDGRTYIQDLGITDGYGIIRKAPKRNKRLQKKLDYIKQHPDEYTIEVVKGLAAWQISGIKAMSGVIVVTSK